jgi:hypothetical protein
MNSQSINLGSIGQFIRNLGKVVVFLVLIGWNRGVFAKEIPPVRYLAFQIFTGEADSAEIRESIPQSSEDYLKTVANLQHDIGITGTKDRKLGVIFGPIAFDNTDEQVRGIIRQGFNIALKTGVAIGFHVDDSMFWGRLKALDTIENLEWLEWNRTPNSGRRLDWSIKPIKIKPQLCLNSTAVKLAVSHRTLLIGEEIARGVQRLKAAHQEDLFIGVIAGWETQIGRDFETGKSLGYCALTNVGFSAEHPPIDIDHERTKIVADFIHLWVQSLLKSGVPKDKVYSHIAFLSEDVYKIAHPTKSSQKSAPYLQVVNFTTPQAAFTPSGIPGFSTYPQPGHLEQLQRELKKHGNPAWASSEGTAIDPSEAERSGKGMGMEGYLGNLFNHGARLVNIFGWGVGNRDNPFRKIAESENALTAYRKFLRGQALAESPLPIPKIPPANLPAKIRKIQSLLPAWIKEHGSIKAKPLAEKLDTYLKQQQFEAASKTADDLLKLMLRTN